MIKAFKILFLALFALVSTQSAGQQQLFLNQTGGAPPTAGLLDQYKGAAFAAAPDVLLYSTYSATDDITGSLTNGQPGQWSVAVFRDFDDSIKSFTPAEVADGTANTWVQELGPSDGFVRRWYDQSVTALDVSNLNHADQSDPTKMPKLFDSATGLILVNGKAAMEINGNFLQIETDVFAGKYPDITIVGGIDSYSNNGAMAFSAIVGPLYWQFGPLTKFYVQGASNSGTGIAVDDGLRRLMNLHADASAQYVRYNGIQYSHSVGVKTITAGIKTYRIFSYPVVGWDWLGICQLYLIYADNQDTNRSGIETAINNEYSIY